MNWGGQKRRFGWLMLVALKDSLKMRFARGGGWPRMVCTGLQGFHGGQGIGKLVRGKVNKNKK